MFSSHVHSRYPLSLSVEIHWNKRSYNCDCFYIIDVKKGKPAEQAPLGQPRSGTVRESQPRPTRECTFEYYMCIYMYVGLHIRT